MTNDVFTIPLERGRFLVYAPQRQVAFVSNTAMVNCLAHLLNDDVQVPVDDGVRDVAALLEPVQSDVAESLLRLSVALTSFEPGRLAIDSVLADMWPRMGQTLLLSFHGSASALTDVGRRLHQHAVRESGRRGSEVFARWIGPGPLTSLEGTWIVDHLNEVMLTGIALPDEPAEFNDWPDDDWSATMQFLDGARFPYRLSLELRPENFLYLESLVRRLCITHKPRALEIRTQLSDLGEPAEPTHTVRSLFSAFKAAQRVARNFDCVLTVPGADLDERQDFVGSHPGEHVARADGSVLIPVSQRLEYCDGCFARCHCAGPAKDQLLEDGGEWAGSERCYLVREVVKGNVLRRIADAGGLVWATSRPVAVL